MWSIFLSGSVYAAAVLDITDEVILQKFSESARNVAAMSRAIGIPTAASAPHCILEGFKYCAAMVLNSDFVFPQMKMLKEMLENPEAFAAAAAPAAGGASGAAAGGKAETKKEEEPEEEEEDDMGFSLFD